MTKLKRVILRISLFLLMALLIGTVLTQGISRLLTPTVKQVALNNEMLTNDSAPPGPAVPIPCLYEDADGAYVYMLSERATLMGRERYVERVDVMVVGRDYRFARISYLGDAIAAVAGYPTKALFDGAIVEVR
jgi:hypothetical protein